MADLSWVEFPDETSDANFARREFIPEGRYEVAIISAEMRDNLAGNGQHLLLVLEVIAGEFTSHRVYHRLNIGHSNPKARIMSAAELHAIAKAIDVENLMDSDQLLDRPFLAEIAIEKSRDGRERNILRRVYRRDSSEGASE